MGVNERFSSCLDEKLSVELLPPPSVSLPSLPPPPPTHTHTHTHRAKRERKVFTHAQSCTVSFSKLSDPCMKADLAVLAHLASLN